MPTPFEFVIDGPPASRQSSAFSRNRWIEDIKRAAGQHWGSEPPLSTTVEVALANFFYGGSPDLDNMAKPILDALKGLVYVDDSQVFDLICRKRNLNGDAGIPNPSQILLLRLSNPGPFVHILVNQATS